MLALAVPSGHGYEFVEIDMLLCAVAGKDVVEAQCAVLEIIGEPLRADSNCYNQ
jgi:hypothetical protein